MEKKSLWMSQTPAKDNFKFRMAVEALKDVKVVDIRKVYKNGVTDSVIDSYRSYLKQ